MDYHISIYTCYNYFNKSNKGRGVQKMNFKELQSILESKKGKKKILTAENLVDQVKKEQRRIFK